MKASLEALIVEIEALDGLAGLPLLVSQVADFVIEATSVDHERLQRFLTHLGKRLVLMANLVESGAQCRAQRTQAAAQLDSQVRSHVEEMQSGIREARSLPDLQRIIEAQLDKVMGSLNRFRDLDDSMRQKEGEQETLLRKRLEESQADLQRLQEELEEQRKIAETDPLTQVANRHKFEQRLQEEYSRWRRYRHPLSLVLLDLDHFKQVNDQHGHATGDRVLQEVSRRLVDSVRGADLVARFGGEEFVILMPETNLTDATKAANKIRRTIAASPIETPDGPIQVTVSMGVAEFEHDDTPEDVLQRADAALYRAKHKGRNQVCCELAEGLSP
jgi:diguanylate cyclase